MTENTRSLFADDPPAPAAKPSRPKRRRKKKADPTPPAAESAPEGPAADPPAPPPKPSKPRGRNKKMTPTEAAASVEDLITSAQPSPINGPLPSLGAPYLKITDIVHDIEDPEAEFNRLRDELSVDGALTPPALNAALNVAEDRALQAHALYLCMKEDHERLESQMAPVIAALRDGANSELQIEKDNGLRSKAITDADISGRAAHKYPDEWREINNRKIRAKSTLRQLERLADLWQRRGRSISAMKD